MIWFVWLEFVVPALCKVFTGVCVKAMSGICHMARIVPGAKVLKGES
jgi:hypothetical protein